MLILIGILLAFSLIVLLIRKKFNFGFSLILGSVVLAIFSLDRVQLVDIGKAVAKATFYSFEKEMFVTQTIELAVLMTLIYMLAKLMQKTGAITKLIESLRTIFSKGGTIGIIPAIYGLMPVPGGALFSAPVVKEEGDKYKLDKNQKNFFNVWFRHIWFPIYPISSNIIIITELAGIDIVSLVVANFSSFLVMIFLGLILLRFYINRNNKRNSISPSEKNIKKNYKGLLYILPPLLPLLFSVLTYIDITIITSFIIGVAVSIAFLLFLTKTDKKRYPNLIKQSLTWKLAAVIFGIMIFREIFRVSRANQAIFNILQTLPFTHLVIIILLPILLGFLTGYLLSGITLSYILLAPFFPSINLNIVGLTSLVFISAYVGYLVSPIHLCNVLSSDYLKTDTTRMYNIFLPSTVLVLIIQIIVITIFFSG